MPFPDALKKFSENGSFRLKNSPLYFDNIHTLERNLQQLKEDESKTPLYRICLNTVQLIPYKPEKSLYSTGPVIEHVPRRWQSCFGDFAITQIASIHELNAPLDFDGYPSKKYAYSEEMQDTPLATLQKNVLSLLTHANTWELIELDHLFFYPDHQIDHEVTHRFYEALLHSLNQNSSLRKLRITPFSLTQHRASLIHFLSHSNELETLHLDINEANKEDWLALCHVLAVHPKLKFFNLACSVLDANAYSALTHLLDENYRIEITLPEPSRDEDLLNAYEPLKQRLSKSGLERFKEKHLSQANLLHIALTTLASLEHLESNADQHPKHAQLEKQFGLLLRNQDAAAISIRGQVKNDDDVLRSIYEQHAHLINEESSSLVQLHVDSLMANNTQTVGYTLLKKAFDIQHRGAMETLLQAGVNLFEFPKDEEEPFLVKVLQRQGDISQLVLDHLRHALRLDKSALLRLSLTDRNKTVGYILLEKSLKTSNGYALRDLLQAKVNLFEFPDDEEEPFLVKVLQGQGEIKKLIVDYIRQDSRLIQRASERLTAADYANLIDVFKDFKAHLDHYNVRLVKREDPSFLMMIANELVMAWKKMVKLQNPLETRNKECAEIYQNLTKSLQMISHDPKGVTDEVLRQVQLIMQKTKEDSTKALRGLLNISYLHDKAVELIDQFEKELEKSKEKIKLKKDKTIQDQSKKIKQLEENAEIERAKAKKRQTTVEAENAKIKTENAQIKTENTQIKTENTQIKIKQTEMEVKLAKSETENTETKTKQVEMEAKQARMEATLNQLLRQMATPNAAETSRASSSQSEASTAPHTSFFARP